MKPLNSININTVTHNEDHGDDDLPEFMKKVTQRMHKGISANRYETHNYKSMVEQCSHLDQHSKKKLLEFFSSYEELISGIIGTVPGSPVKLKLKKEARPFTSPAYTIPKAFEKSQKRSRRSLQHWCLNRKRPYCISISILFQT